MIRTNFFESCAGLHTLDVSNLIFYKDKQIQCINKKLNLMSLKINKDLDLVGNFKKLRALYNPIKIKLNQYLARHKMLNTASKNKIIIQGIMKRLENISFEDFDNDNNKLDSIKQKIDNMQKQVDDAKKRFNSDTISKIPGGVTSGKFKKIFVKILDKSKIFSYNNKNDSFYIDTNIKDDYKILLSGIELKDINKSMTGLNSIYYTNDNYRIYLDNITKNELNNSKIYVLMYKKD